MSKTLKKKKHWSGKVQECDVSWGNAGEFGTVVEVGGGAELGEFPYLGQVIADAMVCHAGRFPCTGDVLLEVNGTPVSGLTNRDTLAVIRHFREPIRLKTVKPGMQCVNIKQRLLPDTSLVSVNPSVFVFSCMIFCMTSQPGEVGSI